MEILICVMPTVKLKPCASVTCLQTHLTRTSLSENSCPHLFQYNVITNAQVSDVFNFEVLKAALLHDGVEILASCMRNILTVPACVQCNQFRVVRLKPNLKSMMLLTTS